MASGNFILDKGYDAAAAMSRYRAVKFTANPEEVTPVVASTDIACGVVQYAVTAAEITKGKGASVRVMGVTEMEAGAAVNLGQEVMCDTSGRAIAATGTGNRVIGLCVGHPAGASGERIKVQLYNGGRVL